MSYSEYLKTARRMKALVEFTYAPNPKWNSYCYFTCLYAISGDDVNISAFGIMQHEIVWC